MIPCDKFSRIWLMLAVVLALGGIVGCDSNNPAPVSLAEVACRPEDVRVDPAFVVAQTHTTVPPTVYLSDKVKNYYGLMLIENALTNTLVTCDLFEMADEAAAIEMHRRTCAVQMDEAESPIDGEASCTLESTGFRLVSFRHGRVVVSIIGDNNGLGVDDWALAVNGRLTQR